MSATRVAPKGLLLLAPVVGCVLLVACTSGQPAPSAVHRDWRTATYTMTCDDVVPDGFEAKLVAGAARVPTDVGETPYYDYFEVRLEAVATGDVDGDGRPDAVVLLQCHPEPSNGIVEEAQVFDSDGHLIGELPSPRTLRENTILPPLYVPAGLRVQRGDVVAPMMAYGPNDSHASGPSVPITVRWHWTGKGFVRVRS